MMRIADGVEIVTREFAQKYRQADILVFPASVNQVEALAFQSAPNLKHVEFENGLSKIGICAFKQCSVLESVHFPQSLCDIEAGAFRDCPNLRAVTFDEPTGECDTVKFTENSFAMCGVCGEVINEENKRRRGFHLRRIFEQLKREELFNEWVEKKSRPACQRFANVNWTSADEGQLRSLIAEQDNGVAYIGEGVTAMCGGAMQPQNYDGYRGIAAAISEVRNNDWEHILQTVRERRKQFFGLFDPARRPWLAFHRIVAALLPEHFVNVPDCAAMRIVYNWFAERFFLDGKMNTDNENWFELSHAVRTMLSDYLRSANIYECGTFAWCIAERFNNGERDNDVRLPLFRQSIANAMDKEEAWFMRNANRGRRQG